MLVLTSRAPFRALLVVLTCIGVIAALGAIALVSASQSASAQAAPAQLSANDLDYKGAFALPGGDDWAYGGHAMTFVPSGDPGSNDNYPGSLVVAGYRRDKLAGEIKIPEPVISSNYDALPVAGLLRGLDDPSDGLIRCQATCEATELSGLAYVAEADRIAWNWIDWYNAGGEDFDSLGWTRRDLNGAEGTWHIGPRGETFHNAKTAGYLFSAPASFASQYLQGRSLIAGNHRDAGTLSGAQGPTLFATAPWQEASLADGATLGATELLSYPYDYDCVANPSGCAFPEYRARDIWGGGVWVETDRVAGVMIVGRKALGYNCYGIPGVDDGPTGPGLENIPNCAGKSRDLSQSCGNSKGYHSGPHEPKMLFYSTQDLAEVALGQQSAASPLPASRHTPSEAFNDDCGILQAATFDRANGLIYVTESSAGQYGRVAVHVWEVAGGGGPIDPTPTATVTPRPNTPTPTPTRTVPTPTPTVTVPGGGNELIRNGDFAIGKRGWWASGERTNPTAATGSYCVTALAEADKPWKAQLGQSFIPIESGSNYRLSFDVSADQAQTIDVSVQLPRRPGTRVFETSIDVTTQSRSLTFDFTAPVGIPDARLIFKLGTGEETRYCMDNVSLKASTPTGPTATPTPVPPTPTPPPSAGVELLSNTDFDAGTDGWWHAGAPLTTPGGQVCLALPSNTVNHWEVQLGQASLSLVDGRRYRLEATMSSDQPTGTYLTVHEQGGGYFEHLAENVDIDSVSRMSTYEFTAARNEPQATVVLSFGGQRSATVCVDRVSLTDLG